jgi:hypothetical protein
MLDESAPSTDADQCRLALVNNRWRVNETARTDPTGATVWVVSASRDDRTILTESSSRECAWWDAWYQAFGGS